MIFAKVDVGVLFILKRRPSKATCWILTSGTGCPMLNHNRDSVLATELTVVTREPPISLIKHRADSPFTVTVCAGALPTFDTGPSLQVDVRTGVQSSGYP